jgi:signal transduction histidine kinase
VAKQHNMDSRSLVEASRFLIDSGYCGMVWLDTELVVRKRLGKLVDFVTDAVPVGDAIIALYGFDDDIRELRKGTIRRFELGNVGIIEPTGNGQKLNIQINWLETSARYLIIVLRSTTQAQLEAELENQSRQQAIAEAKIREQAVQIRKANAELTRANRELSEFANIIAHDLKSPMRGMRWLAEDLEKNLHEDDKAAAFGHLTELQQQARRMSRMLTDLLAYASIGRSEDALVPTDTRALVEEIISSLPRPRGFTVELQGDWPTIETAETALDVVLRNLLDNAIKHHDRQDGTVVMSAARAANGVEFTIADDGPGIPGRYHDVIFQPFRRLDAQTPSPTSGSGIGLSLVRKTTETAGGRLSLTSNPDERRGTTFHLVWPGREVPQADTTE